MTPTSFSSQRQKKIKHTAISGNLQPLAECFRGAFSSQSLLSLTEFSGHFPDSPLSPPHTAPFAAATPAPGGSWGWGQPSPSLPQAPSEPPKSPGEPQPCRHLRQRTKPRGSPLSPKPGPRGGLGGHGGPFLPQVSAGRAAPSPPEEPRASRGGEAARSGVPGAGRAEA